MQIIDNAIDKSLFEYLQRKVLDRSFPWYYGRTSGIKTEKKEFYKTAWDHFIYDKQWYGEREIFEVLLNSCITLVNSQLKKLLRLRLVKNCASETNHVFGPHTDFIFPHKTFLLYFNDSDGDTIIYNEQYNPEFETDTEIEKKLTIKEKIQPRANRLVFFDGLNYHSGCTPCISERRIVLNINYINEIVD